MNGAVLVYITAFPTYQRSGWHVYGGTSAASPQLAALTSLADQERAAAGKSPLGNIDPLIYGGSSWFADVGPVNEGTALERPAGEQPALAVQRRWLGLAGPGSGWPTLSGYDLTTGLGTPMAPAYVAGLAGS